MHSQWICRDQQVCDDMGTGIISIHQMLTAAVVDLPIETFMTIGGIGK